MGVGLPLTIPLLLNSGNDLSKIGFSLTPFLTCIATGYLILLLSSWLFRSSDG